MLGSHPSDPYHNIVILLFLRASGLTLNMVLWLEPLISQVEVIPGIVGVGDRVTQGLLFSGRATSAWVPRHSFSDCGPNCCLGGKAPVNF